MGKRCSENTERNPPNLIVWISLTEKGLYQNQKKDFLDLMQPLLYGNRIYAQRFPAKTYLAGGNVQGRHKIARQTKPNRKGDLV